LKLIVSPGRDYGTAYPFYLDYSRKSYKEHQINRKNATVAQKPPNPAIRNKTGLLTSRLFCLWFPCHMFPDFILASSICYETVVSMAHRLNHGTSALSDWFIQVSVRMLNNKHGFKSIINILRYRMEGLLMDKRLHTSPDPDFNPSIPGKPTPERQPQPEPAPTPATPDEEELPVPPIFPTA
jgi:hypothetical protein